MATGLAAGFAAALVAALAAGLAAGLAAALVVVLAATSFFTVVAVLAGAGLSAGFLGVAMNDPFATSIVFLSIPSHRATAINDQESLPEPAKCAGCAPRKRRITASP
ncbi:MAG TPA: hypothetical protein DD477_11765 [Spirochaetaceae bacterium]|nr:hypothetical protein [Spirochaetaceae bacterium]HAW84794.1 hypothetical protein [Spirochaetaceae bacterium]HAX36750.1 hypothetical protein [Spirochaetaceae bacterium]HBO41873.1 hypothetical protein [Spirochaetaceae bacterium]HCQ87627.1 hypothetical protein [Spirochaetaceae bacterium]